MEIPRTVGRVSLLSAASLRSLCPERRGAKRRRHFNGYTNFVRLIWPALATEAGNLHFNTMVQTIADKWRTLSPEEKTLFKNMALARNYDGLAIRTRSKGKDTQLSAPTAKKRHVNAFSYYFAKVRSSIAQNHPSDRKTLMTVAGDMWRNLSEKERDGYKVLALANAQSKMAQGCAPKRKRESNSESSLMDCADADETPTKMRRRAKSCTSATMSCLESASASPMPALAEMEDEEVQEVQTTSEVPYWLRDHDYCAIYEVDSGSWPSWNGSLPVLEPAIPLANDPQPCATPAIPSSAGKSEHAQNTAFEPVDMYFGDMARLYLKDLPPVDKAEFTRYLTGQVPQAAPRWQFHPTTFTTQSVVKYCWEPPLCNNYCLTTL